MHTTVIKTIFLPTLSLFHSSSPRRDQFILTVNNLVVLLRISYLDFFPSYVSITILSYFGMFFPLPQALILFFPHKLLLKLAFPLCSLFSHLLGNFSLYRGFYQILFSHLIILILFYFSSRIFGEFWEIIRILVHLHGFEFLVSNLLQYLYNNKIPHSFINFQNNMSTHSFSLGPPDLQV